MGERSARPERRDGEATAGSAGLVYVSDEQPGVTRRRRGRGFSYQDAVGAKVTDTALRRRIEELVIPPAWCDVWICEQPDGHMQATGRDEAGRKQYIYHPAWREARDHAKFDSLVSFGHTLPAIRRRSRHDMRRGPLSLRLVTAAVIRLMDQTLIRVGNASYARANGSYGVTTLRTKHVSLSGDEIALSFVAKGGEKRELSLRDREVAEVIRLCQEAPGYELFRYDTGAGGTRTLTSDDVNDYLRSVTGADVTAKDFRTWGGTVIAASGLHGLVNGADQAASTDSTHCLKCAIELAAEALGNTPAVCRQSYVHPALAATFMAGSFSELYGRALLAARQKRSHELRIHEAATLGFLESVG